MSMDKLEKYIRENRRAFMRSIRFICLKAILCMIFVIGLFLYTDSVYAGEASEEIEYVDVHMHFNNQLAKGQRGSNERRPPRRGRLRKMSGNKPLHGFTEKDYIECADNMIAKMDEAGIGKAVVIPQPRISGQKGYAER